MNTISVKQLESRSGLTFCYQQQSAKEDVVFGKVTYKSHLKPLILAMVLN